jgi:PKHD-type hydroxylase
MLLRIAQLLSPQECLAILQTIASAPAGQGWADGRATAGPQGAQVKNNQQTPEDSPAAAQARAVVLAALARNAQFMAATLPKRLYPPSFNRYANSSNTFGSHIDNAVRTLPAPAGDLSGVRVGYVRTDISCTLFLSEPQDYAGGELVIESAGHEQAYKLAAGDLLVYPASTVHRVNPVTQGERIASFFWVESMVRADAQRALLYGLDMSLLSLREKYGETAEAVQLTGTYHNLLRMWSDV